MAKTPYHKAIGSLMYAAVTTRPDIAIAVSALSQFLSNPGKVHWEEVKCVLHYLSGTKHHSLTYGNKHHNLIGFTDAMAHHRSTTKQSQCKGVHSLMPDLGCFWMVADL